MNIDLIGFALAVIALPLVFGLIIAIHEMGHFLVGRWCGVGITTFSIGFGKAICQWVDKHGTIWKIGILPLGGYVKFFGDADAASVPDTETIRELTNEEKSKTLAGQNVWKRIAIVAAGPIANFLLSFLILSGFAYFYGKMEMEPRIGQIAPGKPAEKAGMMVGDLILSIDGTPVKSYYEIPRLVQFGTGGTLTIVVQRGGERKTFQVQPILEQPASQSALDKRLAPASVAIIGIQSSDRAEMRRVHYSLSESIIAGIGNSWRIVETNVRIIKLIVSGRMSVTTIKGPVGTAETISTVAYYKDISLLIYIVAALSMWIGMANLLPIPVLDGGHLLFYFIEALRGKPLSETTQEVGFRIGFTLIVLLTVFVLALDTMPRLFGN